MTGWALKLPAVGPSVEDVSALAGAPLYFLDRLPSMNLCEGLNDLSVR